MPLLFEKTEELTYQNFDSRDYYQAFLHGHHFDVGGGTITRQEIDVIKKHPELKRISIAGLHQDTFEYFIETYGAQFEAIYFFKNKMVSDLSILGTLDHVEVLGYFLNQRAEHLWDMSGNKKLRLLNIDDFSRLKGLNGIEKAPKLEGLCFGNKVWATSKITKVPDLSHSSLKWVCYNAHIPCEETCKFLQIPNLELLDFPTNRYKTEFLAWICANYPKLKGDSLQPYYVFDDGTGFICGKRKPGFDDINSEKGKKRVENACMRFEKMKREYTGMSMEDILKIVEEE